MQTNDNIPVLTVSELTNAIKIELETTFSSVRLKGEISNFKCQASGHYYFSLKDQHAQIAAVMFRGNAAGLKTLPKDGDQVVVVGELNVYPPKGNYQLIVRELTLAGLGELLLKLEELKIKLHKRGWFSKVHKKTLPHLPKRIGVVTSPTGAVIQDILHVLTRRFSGFHLILNPVKVQGEGAAQEIAQAIEQFNRYKLVDVIIVGRGGGSLEDLWAFNEEIVASAIFHSEIPIVCAVGHETDHTIAEYVADVRAPTPSAAAEIVMAEKTELLRHLKQLEKRILQSISHSIIQGKHQLQAFQKQHFFQNPYAILGNRYQQIDDYRTDIETALFQKLKFLKQRIDSLSKQAQNLNPKNQVAKMKQHLCQLERAVEITLLKTIQTSKQTLLQMNQQTVTSIMRKKEFLHKLFSPNQKRALLAQLWQRNQLLWKERLEKLSTTLNAIDPKHLLQKGYTILFSEKEHSVITSIRSLKEQDKVTLLLHDGKAQAEITHILL